MADTAITNAPDSKVTSFSTYRNSEGLRWFGAKWKWPSALTSTSSARRATGIELWFTLGCPGSPTAKVTAGTGTTQYSVNLGQGSGSPGVTISGKTYKRESFWPLTGTKLASISAKGRAYNGRGSGPWVSATTSFKVPRRPTLTELVREDDTGVLSSTIETDPGNDFYERYDTRYQFTVWDSRTKSTTVSRDSTTQSTRVDFTYDAASAQALGYDDYLYCTLRACARGFAGDSAWVERRHVVAWPALATVRSVRCSSTSADGKVTVEVGFEDQSRHPVDHVVLEMLVSSDAVTADDATAAQGWEATGAVDNGSCTALSVGVADVMPERGRTTWLRLKTWHDDEDVFYRHSAPVRLEELERPAATAGDDGIAILSCEPGEDGASAVVLVAWDPDGTDDATGTELSWSADENAWRSTEGPSAFQFAWSDGPASHDGTQYRGSATVYVRGLEEGVAYHVRARRYLERDEGTNYGPYSDTHWVMPAVAPSSVALSVPAYVAEGSSVPVSWTVGSTSPQVAWALVRDSDDLVVAMGYDAQGACSLPAERVARLLDASGDLAMRVEVTTGGEWAASAPQAVRVVEPPELEVLGSVVSAQPMEISLWCSTTSADVEVAVTAVGVDGERASGSASQEPGDSVWAGVVTPQWAGDGEGGYTASVTLPGGLDLWDLADYEVRAVATDSQTGIRSQEASVVVSVDWAHKAPEPPDGVSVEPIDATDDTGRRSLCAVIRLAPSAGSLDGDACDVYRVTPDGVTLVAQGVPPDSVVTDPWAPFGGGALAYRVAVRTPDGDQEWRDYAYELPCDDLRVDFGGEYVELPYDVVVSDSWSKDFEQRVHLDGVGEGYWNRGARRRARLSASVVRDEDPVADAALRALARHSGPCLVRTPTGSAFAADVQVGGLDSSYSTARVSVSLDATEVALGPEYMARVPEDETGSDA